MTTYLVQKRMERKELRRNLADMLGVEVTSIAALISPTGARRAAVTVEPQIPVEVYKGLVSSGNISKFDVEIQTKIHAFYGNGGRHRFKTMRSQTADVIEMVEEFKRKNRRRLYFF